MMDERMKDDLLFICAVIEECGRTTKNRRSDVVRLIGEKQLSHLFELADVYHCEAIRNTVDRLVEQCHVSHGDFDNVAACRYAPPSVMDIAEDYQELIVSSVEKQGFSPIAALLAVYSSPISAKIDDYNSSMYFENPQYLYESYLAGEPLKC